MKIPKKVLKGARSGTGTTLLGLPPGDASLYADGVTDPIVSLDVDRVAVEPGGQVSVTIKITNPGTIVEGYRVEVVGEGVSDWGEALPPEISIYPQQDASAVVVFSPPGGTGAPGRHLAVRHPGAVHRGRRRQRRRRG